MEPDVKTEKGTIKMGPVDITETMKLMVITEATEEPAAKIDKPIISAPHIDAKIVKLLEYYFSSTKLQYDKFLQNEIKTDNGWVKISVLLLNYKRLANISNDKVVIASAVKNASFSLLEADETNEKIRRKPDQEFLNEMIEKSVYCKGFPKTLNMDDLHNFAACFAIKKVSKIRRPKTKVFTGSLYVTFKTKEQAECFLNQESVKFNGVELERKWRKDNREEKKKERAEKIAKKDQKIKAETEKFFKNGYLLKVDNVEESVTVDKIKELCNSYEWKVAFVKIVDDQKMAWIHFKPVKTAKELLEEIGDKENDLKIVFSIPEEEIEQPVLNEMANEMKGVLNMKDKKKWEKNKNRGGKRCNKQKNDDGYSNNKQIKLNHKQLM